HADLDHALDGHPEVAHRRSLVARQECENPAWNAERAVIVTQPYRVATDHVRDAIEIDREAVDRTRLEHRRHVRCLGVAEACDDAEEPAAELALCEAPL